jgi:phosphate transport system substrate-binding protein
MLLPGGAWAETVTIKGSTTVLPIMQKIVEEFMKKYPEHNVAVSGGGSSFGVKALLDRSCDIGMASRLVKPSEEKKAQEKGMYLIKHEIALDAVVPVVHPENPITNLSVDQLRDIYMGKIQDWAMIGGEEGRVVVISRDTSSGTYETWEEYVLAGNRVYRGALLQASNGAVVQAVSKNKNAIGYIGIGYIDNSTKALSVNGIEPTRLNAQDWVFPVVRTLQVYTNGAPKGATKELVDFIKSAEGQKIVAEVGFIELY